MVHRLLLFLVKRKRKKVGRVWEEGVTEGIQKDH